MVFDQDFQVVDIMDEKAFDTDLEVEGNVATIFFIAIIAVGNDHFFFCLQKVNPYPVNNFCHEKDCFVCLIV